jgi:hypothetical protein
MSKVDEFLYTDIALQLFTTFANSDKNEPEENKVILETLFQSLQDDYGDNPFFMPALIYAFMTHMNIVFSEIAETNNADVDDVRSVYVQHYNENIRPILSENISNRPSKHKEILALLSMEDDSEGDI